MIADWQMEAPLDTARFSIHILQADDVTERYVSWFAEPQAKKYIAAAQEDHSLESLRVYVEEKIESDDALLFGIFTRDGSQHIGNLKFEPIDCVNGNAVIGVFIGEAGWRGHGVFQEVFSALVYYMQSTIWRGVSPTIWLGVSHDNVHAVKAYERNGFQDAQPPADLFPNPSPKSRYLVYRHKPSGPE